VKLDKYLNVKINRKIIQFFLENPSSIDTSRNIAIWTNENKGKTEKVLKEFVKAKILVLHGNSATPAYGYTTDTRIITKIKSSFKKRKTKKSKKH
jgi:hypothetical protein